MHLRPISLMLIVGLAVPAMLSAAPILTLTPTADLSGTPGTVVGWGFTITNDADYIEITSAHFCVNPVSFPTLCTDPSTGAFSDFISNFNDIIVGPGDSVSQVFDPLAQTGVGSFQISSSSTPGMSDIGQIVLTYDVFDADPSIPGGNPTTLATDQVLSAAASVTTTMGSATPEPATWQLMAVAALLLAAACRVRRAN